MARTPSTLAGIRFLELLSEDEMAFDNIFCIAVEMLDYIFYYYASSSRVTMKLLIDSKSEKIMFAEAGKECIDFLFLALPIGGVIRLLITKENHVVASGGGLVKGVVTYMVLDDFIIKPMSTISSITLLNQFNIKDVGVLKERVVTLGMDEALKLLKTSLQFKDVLTSVFMDSVHE